MKEAERQTVNVDSPNRQTRPMAGLCGSVISSVPATNFVAVKARKCDRSLQTSPVWRGPNTADSADWYMTGYSPAALAASLVNLTSSFTLFMEESNLQRCILPATEFSSVTNEILSTPQQRDLANAQLGLWKSRLSAI